ncbi:hypothetical protein ARALYDRAFT_358997 [Arabidopsis lyrata subsp. lyrata]|uniref:Uncharacterized protein n=1 Tax=Arabidopsis lyrata subsp. lyrata TaxID=81972 RepID=D7MV96_ARALL|nr:hypothetical protein ARALYDRAFT_358997 [Arabidopsis lyrata subsp. lyrata]
MPEYECLVSRRSYNSSKLSKKVNKNVLAEGERIAKLIPMVSSSDSGNIRIVKQETNFIVSDDLVVTPMKSSSTISLLSKLQMNISDIEEQAISLLRASLITTSALSNGAKLESYLDHVRDHVDCDVAIFHGGKNELIPVECSYSVKSKVPRATVHVIPDKDHITFVVGRQKDFARELELIW